MNRKEIVVNNTFVYTVVLNFLNDNEDHEPPFVNECQYKCDWPKWKDIIQIELNSFKKCDVFKPIVQTHEGVVLIGYK